MSEKGRFIVFEGLDGSGKSTQLKNLEDVLNKRGLKCRAEREPASGAIGRMIREALTGKVEFKPETLALLFAADRYEHITNEVTPALEDGYCVLCDRYVFSNLAYQGSELPLERIIEYNYMSINMLMPDLTIFIDVEPEICFKRLKQSRAELELFEDYDKSIIIREKFFKAFDLLKERTKIMIIDGNGDERAVFSKISEVMDCFLND